MALLDEIRAFELELIAQRLPRGRILELGGGSGYQAALLSARGYEVVALDIPSRPAVQHEHHPIQFFDGVNIPYAAGSFDALFSSNVLEHATQLDALLEETRRVVRQHGVAVHVMPTPAWRFWTSVTHALGLPRRLIDAARARANRATRPASGGDAGSEGEGILRWASPGSSAIRVRRLARAYLLPGPHGLAGQTALQELFLFRKNRWVGELERAGFEVLDSRPAGLFYTGHLSFTWLSIKHRRTLARMLGSACRIYHVRRSPTP